MLPTNFKSTGPLVQENKQKKEFQIVWISDQVSHRFESNGLSIQEKK